MAEFLYDCIVVGSGHAGSCAALSAVESGCKRVLMIDKCPPEWVGGNGFFTAGAHRTVHGGLTDLLPLVRGVSTEVAARIDMDSYTRDDFAGDILRLNGQQQSDIHLVNVVVDDSRKTIDWLANSVGVPFVFSFHRQAYSVGGRQKFWGGMVLSVEEGGKGLIAAHQRALAKAGVEVWFNASCQDIQVDEQGKITGVVVQRNGRVDLTVRAPSVILAAGGFESSPTLRSQYLGIEWQKAKVRGTPFNTGEVMRLATKLGAVMAGDLSGCHSTCWDANAADDSGDRELTNQYTKSGYPLGVMINAKGERFVDEGEDFRNYTYAKFGRAILHQPGGYAFQVWDKKTIDMLRKEEYDDSIVKRITALTPRQLAEALVGEGLESVDTFLETLEEYNTCARDSQTASPQKKWDPSVKDGVDAPTVIPRKSNWALPIDEAPFLAVKVACGVTFTFGGLLIDPTTAGVMHQSGSPIPGLFCAGEMVGGLFYGNYPGGSGLTAGAVFGRRAGQSAAKMSAAER
ncbi:FAD/NAD-P-binding domain-containing protein [Cylindrobasidium torrendii FP15055 ss-10]|uniref:FAD/NAD-P-binding domain-containing protein n=1 Tax=Cylindrobasidium torrendii FP15055 ss-10 TaxID=1314674 RepID=A0A0D7BQ44_9AGAR|nr:FAD/NAD-P-binding domain-containing protein [Cylindrobasidium torrendii FP15055 ss-10]